MPASSAIARNSHAAIGTERPRSVRAVWMGVVTTTDPFSMSSPEVSDSVLSDPLLASRSVGELSSADPAASLAGRSFSAAFCSPPWR